jgi:hypothetical protein
VVTITHRRCAARYNSSSVFLLKSCLQWPILAVNDRNYCSYTASYNENKGIFWETLVGLSETSNPGDILCTLGFRGTAIAVLRHTFDRINATLLGDLADNAVAELHCFSHGIDGAADDNRLSTDAAFRRSINCGKGRLCSIHRLRVLVASHRGSLSLNSGSEVTSETAIQLLRTAHNELTLVH